ncbi:MAG: aldo/keto reductase [Aeropyrum sp.]|nr:aldo/keto reductase [Aeropyrum sp.]MCE4616741.1 aldo/keto reductase [Aeropyrum sp.]
MQKVILAGVEHSRLSFGVYSLTGMYGEVSEAEAIKVLRGAYKLGINSFDTADVYGRGRGETLLVKALGTMGDVRVATKVGYDFYSEGHPKRRYDLDYLWEALRRSLRRLGRSSVDILYLHNPPIEVLRGRTAYEFLKRARREGLARMAGVALGPETDIAEEALEALNHSEVEVLQFVYNMLEQEPGYTIARWSRKHGVSTVARVPHAGGVLDESVSPEDVKSISDHRSLRRAGWYDWAFRTYLKMKDEVLDRLPGTPGQKAISFIFSSAPIDIIVVISNELSRLEEYVGRESFEIMPPSAVRRIREIYLEEVESSPEAPLKSLRLSGVA